MDPELLVVIELFNTSAELKLRFQIQILRYLFKVPSVPLWRRNRSPVSASRYVVSECCSSPFCNTNRHRRCYCATRRSKVETRWHVAKATNCWRVVCCVELCSGCVVGDAATDRSCYVLGNMEKCCWNLLASMTKIAWCDSCFSGVQVADRVLVGRTICHHQSGHLTNWSMFPITENVLSLGWDTGKITQSIRMQLRIIYLGF